jgi:hypothetical protein
MVLKILLKEWKYIIVIIVLSKTQNSMLLICENDEDFIHKKAVKKEGL